MTLRASREVCEGERLSLLVLDRDAARAFDAAEPYAVVSVADPQGRHPELAPSPARRGVLRLTFSDVGEEAARLNLRGPHVAAFDAGMAAEVAAFVGEALGAGVRLLVAHCEAGMSRSAGVAAALAKHYNGDDSFFFVSYRPNRWVRRLVLEAFAETEGGGGELPGAGAVPQPADPA